MAGRVDAGDILKLVRRLASRGARLVCEEGGRFRLWKGGEARSVPTAPVDAAVVAAATARGLIEARRDGSLALNAPGAAFLRRSLATGDPFSEQHQRRIAVRLDEMGPGHDAVANQDESPLAWLRSRKGRDGRPLIDDAAYAAGERLRADFTRGQMMPRVTANWTAAVARSRRDESGGATDLTDAALAARQRVKRALDHVGPEMAGLLVDFSCFLKGIEEIERERQWPARSAKVVLKLALASLARHYGLAPKAKGPPRATGVRHWGTEDYRPTID